MKVAIVGLGTMGWIYANRISRMKAIQLVGAYDRSPEKASKFSHQYGTQVYETFEQLIRKANPDVVCITLPTFLHKEYVVKTAAFGKHVICEKPLALLPQDAEDMMRSCERNGVRLFVGHVGRFFPEYRKIKEAVQSGVIGEVGVAHAKRAGAYPHAANGWYADVSKSGGVIMDLMIHDIDLMRWIIGEIRSVYAMVRDRPGISQAFVTLHFHNSAIASLEAQWGYPGSFTTFAEFAGRQGMIRTDNQSTRSFSMLRREATQADGADGVQVPEHALDSDPYYCELEHFLNGVKTGEPTLVTASDALAAMNVVHAAIRSAAAGLPVTL